MGTIIEELDILRQQLLDLSLRNTLLNYRPLKSKGVTIVNNLPHELFRTLVSEGKQMTFLPKVVNDEQMSGGDEGYDFDSDSLLLASNLEATTPQRNGNKLQTDHSEPELQRRLLNTFYTARTYVEEQGLNILYLALGFLEWYESASSDVTRQAPLILLPVELHRSSVKAPFRLRYTEDDFGENLSLQAKLKVEFGIELPGMPDVGDLNVSDYLQSITEAVYDKPRWRVNQEATALGFFSFGTFLMYHDLDTNEWHGDNDLTRHPIMSALLGNGFHDSNEREALWQLDEDILIDDHVQPRDSNQVVDADSSQILAILAVNHGQNLVIQGPPGTGKSQTITNIIAEAIGAGKKVLFVAEKMAALEVVKRRLDHVGLGDACLELHSHNTNKKAVLTELKRTIDLGKPRTVDGTHDYRALLERQKELNAYSQAVNTPVGKSGVTPYMAYGNLIKLRKALNNTGAPELSLKGALSWTPGDFQKRLEIVDELQKLIQEVGLLVQHPFWGSQYLSFLPQNNRQVTEAARQAQEAVRALHQAARKVNENLHFTESKRQPDAERASFAVKQIMTAPDLSGIDTQANAWGVAAGAVRAAVQSGTRWQTLHTEFDDLLIPAAWKQDVLPLRKAYVAYGAKWWRIFSGEFRRAKRELAGLCRVALPKAVQAQMALIEAVVEAQQQEEVLTEDDGLLASLFREHWRGTASEWGYLTAVSDWLIGSYEEVSNGRLPEGAIPYAATRHDKSELQSLGLSLDNALEDYHTAVATAIVTAKIDEAVRQNDSVSIRELPLVEQELLFAQWHTAAGRIQEMVAYNQIVQRLKEAGLEAVLDAAVHWAGTGELLSYLTRRAWYEAVIAKAFAERPLLNSFNSSTHEQKIESFRNLDRRHFELNRQQLILQHWDKLPKYEAGGQLGILRREFEKRTRHMPIRKLMEQSGNVIQALKPVFMMGPLSIAIYLPPNALHFDLVVFDEASQVRPVDAFGAILRSRQAVVVGDSKQLPPTSFFDKMVDEEEEDSVTAGLDSILNVFSTQGATRKMLRWHYRSRHESLIAVSNYEFYDNNLVIFPSPSNENNQRGLIYHHLPQTHYDRGKSGANRLEAEVVANAVMEHARHCPHLSLGVAAFSIKQMQAIQDQVERLRIQDPSCEEFFAAHPEEPFFVKNLENVQGDERDAIFISVGYGRDMNGHLTMNFGPLNKDGGERRLNVLITRAKLRCEVFTNLKAEDIDVSKTSAQGVIALKRYLKYAETGILDIPLLTGREADSPFEKAVAEAVRGLGYDVDYQVGSAGFFIDLAVKNPDNPGQYLLGVECDGATYHSARSARDRDRLRQQVLEGLGWKIHRIWSTDWFQNPTRQVEKLKAAIEAAHFDHHPANSQFTTLPPPLNIPDGATKINRTAETETLPQPAIHYYEKSPLQIRSKYSLPEMPSSQIVQYVIQVVKVESPVHVEDVIDRIRQAASVARLGTRMKTSLNVAINTAVKNGDVRRQGDFLWYKDMVVPRVRNRQNLASASLKRVAPEEIEMAVKLAASNAYGLRADELYNAVCNVLGFSRVTVSHKQLLQGFVEQLVKEGGLVNQGEFLIVKGEETNKFHQIQNSKEIADRSQVATPHQQNVPETNLNMPASSKVDLLADMIQQMRVGEVRRLKNRSEKKAVSKTLSLQGFTGVYQAAQKCTVWSNTQKQFILNHSTKTLKRKK